MRIIRQPNRWSCTAAAFAMALNINLDTFIELIGHDGSEIIRPNLPEPLCRRGFHVMECIHVAYGLGYSVIPFDAMPCSSVQGEVLDLWPENVAIEKLMSILSKEAGVIMGSTWQNRAHAVAWNKKSIHDPATATIGLLDLRDFTIETFWAVQSNQQ